MNSGRQLAAIMFTDIVGYTALMQADEKHAAALRRKHRQIFEKEHHSHHGTIIQYYGDGTLSIFRSAVEATTCAHAMQRTFALTTPDLKVRIGLHLGDIVYDDTEVYGDGVNVAARIESVSIPGAVLLSGKINAELKSHPNLRTRYLGSYQFKNVLHQVEVYALDSVDLVMPETLNVDQFDRGMTLAVLPFKLMGGEKSQEYLADGMTEEIINALTKIEALSITARQSAFFFKESNTDLIEIGEQLNVSMLVQGSIQLVGEQMRISVRLIDVVNNSYVWSDKFDRPIDDIFAVQDEISLLVAEKFRENHGHFPIEDQLVQQQQVSSEAYRQYLKGRFHILKMDKEEIQLGISILIDQIQKTPNYTYAYLGVHLGYTLLGTLGFIKAAEGFAIGGKYLQKAIAIDDTLPECQLQMAWISFLQDWNLDDTYRHLGKVRDARPIVDFYQTMASVIVVEKKFAAARQYLEKALQLDPFSDINYHLMGFTYYSQGMYREATEYYRKSIELNPEARVSHRELGQSLILLGKYQEALDHFCQFQSDSDHLLSSGGQAMVYAAQGKIDEAQPYLDKIVDALESDQMERVLLLLVVCETLMNRPKIAIAHLESAIRMRLPMLVYLKIDPILSSLQQNEAFIELMKPLPGAATVQPPPSRRYQTSLLKTQELEAYKKALEALMKSQKPYLDPQLSLKNLAEKLALPANHLSQLLNEGFAQNFSEFINNYRLEHFKDILFDPAKGHLTLLALAYESGFNSKTVFNTYFKQKIGMTPRAYRNQQIDQ